MAEIEEIPINAGEAQESEKNIPENNEEIPDNNEELPENTPDKKRGRSAGAKNKPKPPAPKVKSKPKAQAKTKEQPEYEDWSEEDEEPPPPRRRAARQEPMELDRHALAGEVLSILQQQRYNQTSARRNHYASWFTNM